MKAKTKSQLIGVSFLILAVLVIVLVAGYTPTIWFDNPVYYFGMIAVIATLAVIGILFYQG